ncbi:DUF4174 domain-containing protein [Poritiphilus flavus]|uniref:DUF4174 domain-containing protein n=1 Tax=Poritiphilus flavus TaxID=2697053 RepID=A0A6L9EHH1_9FLAO|nr:DUF4174 domain-containing protein [Poritiphilus flavus]NAS14135.1 DUF4174 domain-containing protein [Poritiphilus flavus]
MPALCKPLFFLILLLFFVEPAFAQELRDFRWENRILLIMDSGKDIAARQKQLKLLQDQKKEMEERDLLVFVFTGDSVLAADGTKTAIEINSIASKSFQGVILIGKDGGEKFRKAFPVDPKLIFERIDAMPMRRAEIRAGGKPH